MPVIHALVEIVLAGLVPVLVTTGAILALLLVGLVGHHLHHDLSAWRRRRIVSRYRALVDALVIPAGGPAAIAALTRVPVRHREVVAAELLVLLRVTTGSTVARVREAAAAMGLSQYWLRALGDRRWWRRAEAACALGSVGERGAVPALVDRLRDGHEEVRAAAVEALGRLGDARAIGPLVDGLAAESGLQRTRVVLALRGFGPAVVEPLLAYEPDHHVDAATIADLLGAVGESSALEPLTDWCSDESPRVRAAALRALGTLGPTDRTYYFALRALRDDALEVRVAAARAVARSRRRDAAPYLADALHDAWEVAVEGAHGLRDLGEVGRRELERATGGPAIALAQQMMWEQDRRPAALGRSQ